MVLLHIISPSLQTSFDRRVLACFRKRDRECRLCVSAGSHRAWSVDIAPDDSQLVESLLRDMLPWVRRDGAIVAVERGEEPVKAAIFDLDSTLAAAEFVDLLARNACIQADMQAATARAMNGDADFADSYLERIALLAGTPVSLVEHTAEAAPLTAGTVELLSELKQRGIAVAIATGGYSRPARIMARRLGIETLYAAELEEIDGQMTGRAAGPLVDGEAKAGALRKFALGCGCRPSQVMAAGDGANDIPMLAAAGLGILFHASPEKARPQPITNILTLLGK